MQKGAIGIVGVFVASLAILVACGSDKPTGSEFGSSQGGGGADDGGGQGGSTGFINVPPESGIGGGITPIGTGGSPVVHHQCPTQPDPPCAPKSVLANVTVSDAAELALWRGVTEIQGRLSIDALGDFDAFSCLENVTDNVDIDPFGSGDTSLWGFRNLKTVGGSFRVSGGSHVYVDCGLRQLSSVGAKFVTGGAVEVSTSALDGELDLSNVKQVTHIRIQGSSLTRIMLPSNVMLTMGQLSFERNGKLATIAGFDNVTIKPSSIMVAGAYSVRIVDNPLLSMCRAQQLAQLFLTAGFSAASMTVSGNAPCMM